LFSGAVRSVVDVRSEKLLAITSLVIGIVFFIAAIYSIESARHNYTLPFVESIIGFVFFVMAMGTILPEYTKRPENRKSITLLFVGVFLTIVGGNLFVFTLLLEIVVQFNLYVFTLAGFVMLIVGMPLLYYSRSYRDSLD
jgi:formate hydrogenlyase subunit 3/multisubunit Na+/H+ antiporter MnhD subunit